MKNKSDLVVRIESILKELPVPDKTICFKWDDHRNRFHRTDGAKQILPISKAVLINSII